MYFSLHLTVISWVFTQSHYGFFLLFVVQFSRSCAPFALVFSSFSQAAYLSSASVIIHHLNRFVKHFFQIFSNLFFARFPGWRCCTKSIVAIILQKNRLVNTYFAILFDIILHFPIRFFISIYKFSFDDMTTFVIMHKHTILTLLILYELSFFRKKLWIFQKNVLL